jgi:hypothetical protein
MHDTTHYLESYITHMRRHRHSDSWRPACDFNLKNVEVADFLYLFVNATAYVICF